MASEKAVALQMYGKVEGRWQRGTVAMARNNRVKPGAMVIRGTEVKPEKWTYTIRYYEGGQAKYISAGTDYEKAGAVLQSFVDQQDRKRLEERGVIQAPPPVKEPVVGAEESKEKPLAVLVAGYLAEKSSPSLDLSDTAVRHYENSLNRFLAFVDVESISEVTEAHVVGYIDSLTPKYSRKTLREIYTCVRGFLRNNGVNVTDIIKASTHRRLAHKPEADPTPYTQEELKRLFTVVDDEYHFMIFKTLLSTGMRYRELSFLPMTNVDLNRNVIVVKGQQTFKLTYRDKYTGLMRTKEIKSKCKSRKSRELPIFPSLRSLLVEWMSKNEGRTLLFGSRLSGLPDNHWLADLKRYAGKAGIEKAYLHKFRHTAAHAMLDAGIGIHKVQRILGHASIEQTSQYLRGAQLDNLVDPFAPTINSAAA